MTGNVFENSLNIHVDTMQRKVDDKLLQNEKFYIEYLERKNSNVLEKLVQKQNQKPGNKKKITKKDLLNKIMEMDEA